jgi:uncharacterized membrane protein
MVPEKRPQFDAGQDTERSAGDSAGETGETGADTSTYTRRINFDERRLPLTLALTLLVAMALPFLSPEKLSLGPKWLLVVLLGIFLIATLVAGPELVKGRAIVLRAMAIGVVVVLVVKDSWSTANLLIDLIKGGPETNNPTGLLITGGVVWVANNIVFAMLYWELDSGGPIERARRKVRYPDLAFPGQLTPDIVPPGWRPVFIDYLYLGFTNALAFSPTDVMPLAHWAKLTMALQSFISVAILSLVVARAVNILT